jgi:hypothetical protein
MKYRGGLDPLCRQKREGKPLPGCQIRRRIYSSLRANLLTVTAGGLNSARSAKQCRDRARDIRSVFRWRFATTPGPTMTALALGG